MKLAGNNFTGGIPAAIADLAFIEIPKLRTITLENNKFDKDTVVPAALCNIPGIQITIDKDILCPGGCCTTVKR